MPQEGGGLGGQERALDSLELKLQVVCGQFSGGASTELGPPGSAWSALHSEPSLQPICSYVSLNGLGLEAERQDVDRTLVCL